MDDSQDDPKDEKKHDQETLGKPGSSQDDMQDHETRQTGKRHRESPFSPDVTTGTSASVPTPTSARTLFDEVASKPNRKQRKASAAAAAAINQQQQQEEQQHEDDHEYYTHTFFHHIT